jgi:apolipoprotein N-acyltransferase
MTTHSLDVRGEDRIAWAADLTNARLAWAWWAVGLIASLLAVGGRWDIPLAAWVAPVFLLRFSRLSRPATAICLVWVAGVAAAFFWGFQLNVRVQASTVAGHVAFGTIYTLPYVLDRLVGPRLPRAARLLMLPAAMASAEYLMAAFSPLGTAYGTRAITQHGNLALLQLASITGPYGIAFLIGWLATTVNWGWEPASWARAGMVGGIFTAVLLAVLLGGAARLAFVPPSNTYVRVAGITPSEASIAAARAKLGADFPASKDELAQSDPAKLQAAFDVINGDLLVQTRQAARAGAKIVVWSETAARLLPSAKPAFLQKAAEVARQEGVYLNVANAVPFQRNETHLFDPAGKAVWWYWKNHPVPGMEPVPPGNTPVPVAETPFGRLSNVICFDADFPALTRRAADIMIVPGADWPEMGRVHTMKMASLRAIENGYSLIRQDYDGQSAAFDPQGRVLVTQDTTHEGPHLMMVDLPTKGSPTLYGMIGDVFVWLCVAGTLLLLGLGLFRRATPAP